jgi:hypothetical protein
MGRVAYLALILVTLSATTYGQTASSADSNSISLGSWGAAVLSWVIAITAPAIGAALVALIYKAFELVGIHLDNKRREKLQDIIVNGINLASLKVGPHLQGKYDVNVRNQIVFDVLTYVKDHGREVLASLGVEGDDAKLAEIITARVTRAINDPLSPTPPELTPPEVLAMGRTRQAPSIGTDGVEQRPVDVGGAVEDSTTHPFNHVRY